MQIEEKKENRGYIVWSIVMGVLLGFIVNIFSNIYYGIYVIGNLKWSEVNQQQLMISVIVFVALIGYLLFFVSDYPNTFEFSKAYWKRFRNYFFYDFIPGRILRWIIGLYLLLFIIGLLVLIYYLISLGLGYMYAAIVFVCIFVLAYAKRR